MRNLLLGEDKKAIRREYLLRLAIIALSFVFVTVLFAGILLLPSYFISDSKERTAKERHEIIEQSIAAREGEASLSLLSDANQKLALLTPQSKAISLERIIDTVVSSLPRGVTVTKFFYTYDSGKGGELSIAGKAETREDLLAFQSTLRGEPLFETVTLPISNLAADKDIAYSMAISGAF